MEKVLLQRKVKLLHHINISIEMLESALIEEATSEEPAIPVMRNIAYVVLKQKALLSLLEDTFHKTERE